MNKEIKKTITEMVPILTFCICFGITAGLLLNLTEIWLDNELFIGILVITPAIMALGGYISSIFGMNEYIQA